MKNNEAIIIVVLDYIILWGVHVILSTHLHIINVYMCEPFQL